MTVDAIMFDTKQRSNIIMCSYEHIGGTVVRIIEPAGPLFKMFWFLRICL